MIKMSDGPDKYFVWMKGTRGAIPQLWYNLPTDGGGKPTKQAAFVKALELSEANLSLSELAEKYKDKKDGQRAM